MKPKPKVATPSVDSGAEDTLRWRSADASDEAFLRELVISRSPLPPVVQDLQWQAWYASHRSADLRIVLRGGRPIGFFIWGKGACDRLVDVVVAPNERGRGHGTALIRQLQALHPEIELRVEKTNAALRLYKRLGFEPIAEDELAIEMRWKA